MVSTAAPLPAQISVEDALPDQSTDKRDDLPIQRFKKQAIQGAALTAGWLGNANGDLNNSFFEASMSLGIPLGSFDNVLGVTPAFRADYLDSASHLDLPGELFEAGVSFFYRRDLSDRWGAMAIVRPSIRSDFSTSDNAFRIFGLGLLTWDVRPKVVRLSFGAVYLDRADLSLLPAVGLTWTPDPEKRFDLQFPESTAAWRLQKNGSESETWLKLKAGIGGNTWAVTRSNRQTDQLSLRDVRVLIGVDHVTHGGGGWFADFGYAFQRKIHYESTDSEWGVSDGVLVQAGWRY